MRDANSTYEATSLTSPGKRCSRNTSCTRRMDCRCSANRRAKVDLPAAILPQKKTSMAWSDISCGPPDGTDSLQRLLDEPPAPTSHDLPRAATPEMAGRHSSRLALARGVAFRFL